MTKTILSLVALAIALSSCSSDEAEDFGVSNFSNGVTTSYDEGKTPVIQRASFSVTGYDDVSYLDGKVTVNSFMANYLQLAPGVYLCKAAKVVKYVDFPDDGNTYAVAKVESPYCGFRPLSSNKEIGYDIAESATNPRRKELITKCFYIKNHYGGAAVNKWIPCKPEDVKWNYKTGVISFD